MIIKNELHDNAPEEQQRFYTEEEKEKIVGVLNNLVQINNDRIEGYGHAEESTEDVDLKVLFNRMMSKSQILNVVLSEEVLKYSGKPTESTTLLGKAFRVWMDLKATLTGKDRKAILESCEFGEEAAQETYADAIKDSEFLPVNVVKMISYQKAQLLDDLNHVKFLREKN